MERYRKVDNEFGRQGKRRKGVSWCFCLKGRVFPFHRPHPQKEAKKYQIQDLRKFLREGEIIDDDA